MIPRHSCNAHAISRREVDHLIKRKETEMRSERLALLLFVPALLATMIASANSAAAARVYPMHTNIVSTTFWVGEIFNSGPDGSQVISTYDGRWYSHFGGCDGKIVKNKCQTEPRTAANNFFPTSMTPEQNPFYLDLPFDDINDRTAYKERCSVVPWANDPGSIGNCKDQDFSYMKNRWVQLTGPNGRTCYGQVEDAGPGQYHDANYVFGSANAQPVST